MCLVFSNRDLYKMMCRNDCLLKFSLTDVIVKCFVVKFLMDPVLLNLENLLAARILFAKRSSQNHFQFFDLSAEKRKRIVFVCCMLNGVFSESV